MEITCLIQRSRFPRKRSRYDIDDPAKRLGYVNYIPKKICIDQKQFINDYNVSKISTVILSHNSTVGNPTAKEANLSNHPNANVRFSDSNATFSEKRNEPAIFNNGVSNHVQFRDQTNLYNGTSNESKLVNQPNDGKFTPNYSKPCNQQNAVIFSNTTSSDSKLNSQPSDAKFSSTSPANDVKFSSQPNDAKFSSRTMESDVKLNDVSNDGNLMTDEYRQLLVQINLDAKLKQERTRRIKEQNQLMNSRKLSLVLDLDLTLLNSTTFCEVNSFSSKLEETLRKRQKDGLIQDMYRIPQMKIWTKLRPGVRQFLTKASKLYELHVCTMGNRVYARAMTKLLDPTGTLFCGRIIAKGSNDSNENDPAGKIKTKDLEGILGLESAVIIVDDSSQVWPYHRFNLLQIEKYMYFPSTRKQFNLAGPSLFDIGHDENVHNGTLASMLTVLENIHYNFFSKIDQNVQKLNLSEKDARCILASEKKKVLAGCKIVFSRVFPQGETRPHLHPLWLKAQEFGAECSMVIDDSVTHVVATSRGTDKVLWAIQTRKACVSPTWIEASTYLYRRFNEQDFPVPQ